uniref:Uncharacterized protein n=1 Tax=Anguilla anguilla TaxID=7936 RepID=A0A0E9PQL5_ANGAN
MALDTMVLDHMLCSNCYRKHFLQNTVCTVCVYTCLCVCVCVSVSAWMRVCVPACICMYTTYVCTRLCLLSV